MKTLTTLAFITLTGALFGATNTFAGDVQSQSINVRSKVVTFYDLDLANPADAQTLLNRIQRASKGVCKGSGDRPIELRAAIDRNRCMESSYRDTVAQVDSRFNTSIEKIAAQAEEQRDLVSKR